MAKESTQQIDWSGCDLVKRDPLTQSGDWVIKGTRTPVSLIMANSDLSAEEIAAQVTEGVPVDVIEDILFYGKMAAIDWSGCSEVERVEGRRGGVWTLKDSRITPDEILIQCEDQTPEYVAAHVYPHIPLRVIVRILSYAQRSARR